MHILAYTLTDILGSVSSAWLASLLIASLAAEQSYIVFINGEKLHIIILNSYSIDTVLLDPVNCFLMSQQYYHQKGYIASWPRHGM